MKTLVMAIIVSVLFVSCGSKKTEAETTMNNEVQQVETTATETMTEAKEEATETMTEAKEEMTASADTASTYNCSQGSDERVVEIINGENPKCEVFYTKGGEKLSIAKANWDTMYCDKVANQVKGNLETAGFSCN